MMFCVGSIGNMGNTGNTGSMGNMGMVGVLVAKAYQSTSLQDDSCLENNGMNHNGPNYAQTFSLSKSTVAKLSVPQS